MALLLTLAAVYVPRSIRRRKLEVLSRATADAFRATEPCLRDCSPDECLRLYAEFTREQAERAIRNGSEQEVRARLYQNAYRLGRQLKSDYRVGRTDIMRAGSIVYRMLGIDFKGTPGGEITISRCFFSTYYSSHVCELISSLDEGLLVGLAGEGKLSFHQRITEGAQCCLAHLKTGEGAA